MKTCYTCNSDVPEDFGQEMKMPTSPWPVVFFCTICIVTDAYRTTLYPKQYGSEIGAVLIALSSATRYLRDEIWQARS